MAYKEDVGIDEVIDTSEKQVFDVAQSGTRTNFVHIKDLLKDAYERAERADKDEAYLGISTGLKTWMIFWVVFRNPTLLY